MNSGSRGMVRSPRGALASSRGAPSHSAGMSRGHEEEFVDESGSEVRGVEEAREGILKFLTMTLGSVKVDTVTVQLFQHGFQSGKPFHHFPFNTTEDDVDNLADEIAEIAKADISDCGASKIAYAVMLAGHNGRKNFTLTIADNEESSNGGVNDAEMIPTLRHGWTQQMGHNQIMFEVTVGSLGAQNKRLSKENDRLVERIQHYEAERERYIESREAILSAQHDRDMDIKKQDSRNFYMGQVASMGMNTIAPLINNYMKEKFVPVKATPLENMMITLASTIETPQMQALLKSGILSAAQGHNLLQIVASIQEAAAKEKKEGGFIPPPTNKDPSDNRNGGLG